MILYFLAALIVKHFIADFPLQSDFQYSNKGRLFHPGGLLHGFITIATTAIVLFLFHVPYELWFKILGVEFLVHYFMDFVKVRIGHKLGWSPSTGHPYFILMGFDQMVHYLTYIWIGLVVFPS